MAISEFESFKVEKAAKEFCSAQNKHVPPEQLYFDYKLEGQTLYLLEVRPGWKDPSEKTEVMVAKFLSIKKEQMWKLYWQRQNMKWQRYEPDGINAHLEPLLKTVEQDTHGCFWG